MRLGYALEKIGEKCPEKYQNLKFTDIVTDSRKAHDGCMFICLGGHNRDGHDYIRDAIDNGAVVIVAEQVRERCVGGAAVIEVDNTSRCAALLYNLQCGSPTEKLKIIGVTGTNGKTSTCAALDCILREAGYKAGVIGTLGCFALGEKMPQSERVLTTPMQCELYEIFARMVKMGITHVIMEVSSHALAFGRTDAINFEYGIFTNLSRDHLDFHGDMEEYFRQKSKLFGQSRRRVVNFDDPYGKRLCDMYGGTLRLSRSEGDILACNINSGREGCEYSLRYKGIEQKIKIGATGDFSVTNTALAASVALDMGISPEVVARGLIRFFGAEGRMKRITAAACPFDIFIDYAHTPDALENTLMSIRSFKGERGKIILLFGCGGNRDRGKRKQMGSVASRLADFIIITSDNSREESTEQIIEDILKGINKEKEHTVIVSRRQAIKYAVEIAAAGDIVLLAGKGHEKYEIDAEGTHPFDEEKIALSELAKR